MDAEGFFKSRRIGFNEKLSGVIIAPELKEGCAAAQTVRSSSLLSGTLMSVHVGESRAVFLFDQRVEFCV